VSANTLLALMLSAVFAYSLHLLRHWGDGLAKGLGKGPGEVAAGAFLLATVAIVLVANWFPLSVPTVVWTSPLCYLEQAAYAIPGAAFFGLAGARLADLRQRRSVELMAWVLIVVATGHFGLAVGAREHAGLVDVPFPGPVCRQSTGWSCGAAASATLFKAKGVTTTEREMAELCLTYRARGTTLPRFVRGLALKAERDGLPWMVRAETGLKAADMDRFPLPAVVAVRWSMVADHAVCLFGRDEEGRWLVGEVTAGVVEHWPPEVFAEKFKGEAITLVPR
jgi:hypothetical protein